MKKNTGFKIITLILFLSLLFLPARNIYIAANDVDQKSMKMSADIEKIKEKIKDTEQSINSIRDQANAVHNKLQQLELKNEELQKDKELLIEQIKEAEKTLLHRQNEQLEAEKRLLQKKEQYQKRIASMFYFKQRSPLEILLSSRGIDGFFSNMRMIEAIATADANMITDLGYAEEIKKAATEIAEKTKNDYDNFLEEKLAEIADLEEGIALEREETNKLSILLQDRSLELQDTQRDLKQKEAAFAAYKAALAKYSGQISKLNPAGSNAVWPLPASQNITSPYGYRELSFDASNGYVHTGTDFADANVAGTPVVAAWEGIVVNVHRPYPGQMYANDANYVQISHGAGLGTGYWHLLDTAVVVGQHVAKGEVIGYCGSTGMSQGPHLHFEVYDENNPKKGLRNTVDPMLYLGG